MPTAGIEPTTFAYRLVRVQRSTTELNGPYNERIRLLLINPLSAMGLYVTRTAKWQRAKKKAQTPLLPGDVAILKQLDEERKKRKPSQERLENLGPAKISWQHAPNSSLQLIISSILSRVWEQVPEKGVYFETKTNALNYRARMPPLLMVSQIYGVFPHDSTFIDREILKERRKGNIRLLSINVPDCSDLIIEAPAFYQAMDETPAVLKLQAALKQHPDASWLSTETLSAADLSPNEISQLVAAGHLTIDPGNPMVRNISTPMQGAFLKLVLSSRRWLVKTLKTNKWNEYPEDMIQEKLNASKFYWKDLRGVSLEWILYDAIGSGYIDSFQTPIGRGWKLLRNS